MMGTFPDKRAEWLEGLGYDIPNPNWKLYTSKRGLEYEQGGDVPAPLSILKEHHDTWFMVDQVKAYIEENKSNFCVHLSLLRPHPPWAAPEPYNC